MSPSEVQLRFGDKARLRWFDVCRRGTVGTVDKERPLDAAREEENTKSTETVDG